MYGIEVGLNLHPVKCLLYSADTRCDRQCCNPVQVALFFAKVTHLLEL